MRHRPLTVLLALALAAVCAGRAQAASSVLPGTDAHGVRLVQRGSPPHLVVLLSRKRYRTVAGNELQVVCAPVPQSTLGGGIAVRPGNDFRDVPRPPDGVVARLHPPRHRTPLVTRLSPHWDWCTMVVRKARHHGRSISDHDFATIPLTRAGAAFVDERRVAARVIVVAELLTLSRRWATHLTRFARLTHAVVLGAPTAAPPPGRLGVFSDGMGHIYVAQTDHASALLFIELDGDVVRTNLARYLQDGSLLWGAFA